ncbi:MAG: hypothetical protein V4710_11410 [Verrucomicrobiota bacterium]
MLALEERRETLEQELNELAQQLSQLKGQLNEGLPTSSTPTILKGSATSSRGTAAAAKTTKAAAPAKAVAHFESGSLKDKVMSALNAAGSEGVHVKELAEALGTKPVNIHSWFHSNIKRNPAIKKITGGHYRLDGGSSSPSTSNKSARKSKTQKVEAEEPESGSRRGALKAQILNELAVAGAQGITVRDLADKIGTKYKNVYIWFSTTGKKGLGIEKVGKATYRLAR